MFYFSVEAMLCFFLDSTLWNERVKFRLYSYYTVMFVFKDNNTQNCNEKRIYYVVNKVMNVHALTLK